MTTYQSLGPAQGGPNTASLDETGLNTGNLTNQLTGSFIGKNPPQFELYHATVTNVPAGASAQIYVNRQLYSFTFPFTGSEWDPSQPLFLRPGDEIDFFWNIAATVPLAAPIQTAVAGSFGTAALTIHLPAASTAGTCMVACIASSTSTVTGITIGGSASNWAQAKTVADSGGNNYYIWTNQNGPGGQTTIVVSLSASNSVTCRVYEVPGVLATGAVDASASGAGSGLSFTSGTSGTTVQASEIAIGMVGMFGASTPGITGPAAFVNTQDGWGPQGAILSGYQILSAVGTVIYNGTMTPSQTDYGALAVTLKGVSPSGAAPTQFPVVTTFYRFDIDLPINKSYATTGL